MSARGAGEGGKPGFTRHFDVLKSACNHFENEIPPFPMWQSFLQIADIPSEVFACQKEHVTDVSIPKSLSYCFPCPRAARGRLVMPLWQGTHRKVSQLVKNIKKEPKPAESFIGLFEVSF